MKDGGCYVVSVLVAFIILIGGAIFVFIAYSAGAFDGGGSLQTTDVGAICVGAIVIFFVIGIIAASLFTD